MGRATSRGRNYPKLMMVLWTTRGKNMKCILSFICVDTFNTDAINVFSQFIVNAESIVQHDAKKYQRKNSNICNLAQ